MALTQQENTRLLLMAAILTKTQSTEALRMIVNDTETEEKRANFLEMLRTTLVKATKKTAADFPDPFMHELVNRVRTSAQHKLSILSE
jgi:hypothetical protein